MIRSDEIRPTPKADGPTSSDGLATLDEGIRLLRRMPASAFLLYWGASAPFALGVVFFWSDMSRSAFARERCPGLALALALLFVLMKACQAYFCAWLACERRGQPAPAFSPGTGLRVLCAQAFWQSLGLVAIPLALLAILPFAWSVAFFQNLLALSWSTDTRRASLASLAARQSFLRPKQNHVGLCLLALVTVVVFLSAIVSLLAIPYLARALFGVKTFAFGGTQVLNSTLWVCAMALTWLAVDPLCKAFYVLRCFHGLAQKTGADLLVDLARARPVSVVALLLFVALLPAPAFAEAADETLDPVKLDQAIAEIAQQPRYAWRSPRERGEIDDYYGLFAFVEHWTRALHRGVENVVRQIGDWLTWLERRVWRPQASAAGARDGRRVFAWLLILSFAALASFLLVRIISRRKRAPVDDTLVGVRPRKLDLAADDVSPEDLPTDEWFVLAARMRLSGEWRLALRALFLAALAGLGRRKLLRLERGKSGRDYVGELRRRDHPFAPDSETFAGMTRLYECVWYGTDSANEPMVREFESSARRLAAGPGGEGET